ncbi:Cof-type HAD-IIB family hydrolase [Alkalihalobacillus sp. MEB130]|uniref:Cof-type HAD-IIB family hydrolase n=1 Tax=Alkalihalobacillus sp. MEB130 TaxID=2976704 RepID=UPI0028DDFEB9|nr:Cof-type HAD-IIB family hydrolase [Alkalihalobacillus sp. MEB130]MDT8859749.1 Cof-type HAD-IIB family hydrolase [Alkalihalobacillus sp. MEB130]
MEKKDRNLIKLIAIDMDGTLLNERKEISEENRKAIKEAEEKGVHVVISTGRTRMTCDELVQSLSLQSYLITVNGSEIWDERGELIERKLLHTTFVEQMWQLKQTHNTICWAASVDNVWRDHFPEDFTAHEWMKFGFDIKNDDVRKTVLAELEKNPELEITNSSPTNLEINAAGVNKAKAIEVVCNRLGFAMENVLALGDSLNDLAMIKEAGVGVAMGNAQPFVKESADWVTSTNEEDGVAKAIRTWVL